MKNLVSLISLALLPSLVGASEVEINGIYYNIISERDAEVTFDNTKYIGHIKIPSTIFYRGKEYQVSSIGSRAFMDCSELISVEIPNSIISIGEAAFFRCFELASITIPNRVKIIGGFAFHGCSNLKSIAIPNGVSTIKTCTFAGCTGLISIKIPRSVTTIEADAFSNCTGLNTVDMHRDVRSIKEGAFRNCSGLISIVIPNSVTTIEDNAFNSCTGLTSVDIPNSVRSIGEGAFKNCSSLISIVIPNSVTSIGEAAFYGCTGLTYIRIPRNVITIGHSAFGSCSNLTSVRVEPLNEVYDSRNNCNAIIETSKNCMILGCQNTKIPNSVLSIDERAFNGCTGLTSIYIPRSVKSIGESLFCNCSNLASICVDSQNTVYDSRNDCNAIIETSTNTLVYGCRNTLIPSDVTSIADDAFEGCTGLISIRIPNSVRSIGYSAFSDCTGLTSIFAEGGIPATIKGNTFDNVDKKSCLLHVPRGRKETYEKAQYWNEFEKIVKSSNNTTNNEGEPSNSLFDIICEQISNFFLFIKSLVK